MWLLIGISGITFLGAAGIWGTRLLALRRGETLPYYDYYVFHIIRTKVEELYGLHLHERLFTLVQKFRQQLFVILKSLFLIFRSLTVSIEHRLLMLMNIIRGRREERVGTLPSAFIGELKNHKEGLQGGTRTPA